MSLSRHIVLHHSRYPLYKIISIINVTIYLGSSFFLLLFGPVVVVYCLVYFVLLYFSWFALIVLHPFCRVSLDLCGIVIFVSCVLFFFLSSCWCMHIRDVELDDFVASSSCICTRSVAFALFVIHGGWLFALYAQCPWQEHEPHTYPVCSLRVQQSLANRRMYAYMPIWLG